MVGREPPEDEKIETVKNILTENGGEMVYKELQVKCEDLFEGVRLLLKKMKSQGIVEFDGMIPGFQSVIKLL